MTAVILATDASDTSATLGDCLTGPVVVVPLDLTILDTPGDLIIVDARTSPDVALRLCPLIAARPVILVITPEQWPLVNPGLGIADVIAAPSKAECAARIRLATQSPPVIAADVIVINEESYRATVAGEVLDLTYTEFELLKFFVAHPGKVHSRESLLAEVWGYNYFGGTRTVDVHVRRLRAKLGTEHDALIETVRNVGYRFSPR